MTNPPSLGEFEQLVLLAVMRLNERAYGVSIHNELAERTGRQPATGALYTTLERLERKRLVRSRTGDPTPERGGRAKRYYTVTALGTDALVRAHRAYLKMSEGLALRGASLA